MHADARLTALQGGVLLQEAVDGEPDVLRARRGQEDEPWKALR